MTAQLELSPAKRAPCADAALTSTLMRTLRQFNQVGKRWVTARAICDVLGWPWSVSSRRKVTKAAEALGWRVIGSRSQGYCLAINATRDELQRSVNTFRSQAADMERKAIGIINFIHRGERKAA
jgi:hypothetical protein